MNRNNELDIISFIEEMGDKISFTVYNEVTEDFVKVHGDIVQYSTPQQAYYGGMKLLAYPQTFTIIAMFNFIEVCTNVTFSCSYNEAFPFVATKSDCEDYMKGIIS